MKPYNWQQPEVDHLTNILATGNVAICGSDTGVGKTVISLAVAGNLGLKPLIVAPKAVLTSWRETAQAMGIEVLDIVNIEKLKARAKRKDAPLQKNNGVFAWSLEPGTLIIFDEAHRFSGRETQNSKILAKCRIQGLKVLLVSATLADDPTKTRALGYLLELHRYKDFNRWLLGPGGCRLRDFPGGNRGIVFDGGPRGQKALELLNQTIYPARGHRIRVAEVPGFPEVAIYPEVYDLGNRSAKETDELYALMQQEVQDAEQESNPLTQLLRLRQKTEILKIPVLIDRTNELLEEGKSVVVFVSFRKTFFELRSRLDQECSQILGDQKDRDEQIAAFQRNQTRVCLCMAQAGGLGINLGDTDGKHPRVSLITPVFSVIELKQVLGRIHRANSKSKAIQYIVYGAGTVEENICRTLKRKIQNLNRMQDADLQGGLFT